MSFDSESLFPWIYSKKTMQKFFLILHKDYHYYNTKAKQNNPGLSAL